MSELIIVPNEGKEKAILDRTKDGRAKSLAGGLNVPEGTHRFVVADKKAFGLLEVGTAPNLWILPIVAGSMLLAGSEEELTFEVANNPGVRNLVVPDSYFLKMKPGEVLAITVETRKGRKVVANVAPYPLEENVVSERNVQSNAKKKQREPAF